MGWAWLGTHNLIEGMGAGRGGHSQGPSKNVAVTLLSCPDGQTRLPLLGADMGAGSIPPEPCIPHASDLTP